MIQAAPSQGYAADIQTVNQDGIVVLHRWSDGMLLVMAFDDDLPAFTTKSIEPAAALEAIDRIDSVTTATGYVFWTSESDPKGSFEFEDRRYSLIDIEDYVVWTDEEAVRRKYDEVVAKARAE